MKPSVKFKLKAALDEEMCFDFFNFKSAGIDFGKGIIALHPQLRSVKALSPNKRKKAIAAYVIRYYRSHKRELAAALERAKKDWQKVEPSFFSATARIFGSFPWPKGKYIGYLSIFNCNPRFLSDKTFQIFYQAERGVRRLVAHEMLHFIFYTFLEKKGECQVSEQKKWILSEVFNAIILNEKEFKSIIAPVRELGYPEHRSCIRSFTKEWEKHRDIIKWLGKAARTVR